MSKTDSLAKMLNENNGYLYTAEVTKAGISKTYLLEYAKRMNLERISRGIYQSPESWPDSFNAIQKRYPTTIFSHETAAYLLNLANREPLSFSVTAKSGYNTQSLKAQSVKVYQIQASLFKIGLTNVKSPLGHDVQTYNAERTVCDYIRSRTQIEIQDFRVLLHSYVQQTDKDLSRLIQYAKYFRVEKLIRQYMEILL